MRKRLLYFLLSLLVLPMAGYSQDAMPLSLQQAIDYALRHNYTVKNARIDVEMQKSKNNEITGNALPQVSGKVDFQAYPKPSVAFLPGEFLGGAPGSFVPVQFLPKYNNTVSVTASQLLFDGTVLVALQARNTLIKLTQLNAQATEEDVRYNVKRAYYALVVSYQQYQLVSKTLSYLREIAREQKAYNEEGLIEKIEVDRVNVQVNNSLTDSIRIASLLVVSEQLLKYNMGLKMDQKIALTDTSVTDAVQEAQDFINVPVEYNRVTGFNLLQTQLLANEYDLKRYKYSGLPSLSTFFNPAYTYGANRFKDVVTPGNYIFFSLVGVQLNVPIFTGLQRTYQVKQAKLAIEKTKNDINNTILAIDQQSESNKILLKNNLAALENQRRNLDLAATVMDLAQKKYRGGVGSNLEVTQAQTEYNAAQNNYFSAMLEVINSTTDLQRALGLFK